MINVNKLERMDVAERSLEKIGFIEKERIKGMMLIWEVIEDKWMLFKNKIADVFGHSNGQRRTAADIVTRVRNLLAEQGKTLTTEREDQFLLIAENIAGESLDFYTFMTMKNALHSRMTGGPDGSAKSAIDPLTTVELEGLSKTLVLVIFNTIGNITVDLKRQAKEGSHPEILEGHAKSIARLLSLPIWNALLVQRPNLVIVLHFILEKAFEKFPRFLQMIEANMGQDSMEMTRALFDDPIPQAAELRLIGEEGSEPLTQLEADGLRIAQIFMQRKSDILRARETLRWILKERFGDRYPEVQKTVTEITGKKSLTADPGILFKNVSDLLVQYQISSDVKEKEIFRTLTAQISSASIDFAIYPIMQRAVKNREQGGELGGGKAPDEPMTRDELTGLLENAASVIFATQLVARRELRNPSATEESIESKAQGLANQLNRPRWKAVLAQAPDVISFLRMTIGSFPKSFREKVSAEMRSQADYSPAMDRAIFGADSGQKVQLGMAA